MGTTDSFSRDVNNPSQGTVPAMLKTVDKQGVTPVRFQFDIVAREGQFTDTTVANYSTMGTNASWWRTFLNEVDKRLPEAAAGLRGELTTRFESVQPKNITFDAILRANNKFPPNRIIATVAELQSLCYPRFFVLANPPLCKLMIANLYSLEGYVTQVMVNWHNQWRMASGLPMGCDINIGFLMHQYPTQEEVRVGAGFYSAGDKRGFAGTTAASTPDADVSDTTNPLHGRNRER